MVYAPERHGFFDDLVTMLVSLSSYMFSMHVSILSNKPTPFHQRPLEEWISYIAPIKTLGFPLALDRRADEQSLIVYPAELIMPISLNGWPQFIEYDLVPIEKTSPSNRLSGGQNDRLFSAIVGASFVSYYAKCESSLETRFGKQKDEWPNVCRFAWAIRNGFAHGGVININNPQLPPITWEIWTLDVTSNGRHCLFDAGMLGIGDIVALMEQLDSYIAE